MQPPAQNVQQESENTFRPIQPDAEQTPFQAARWQRTQEEQAAAAAVASASGQETSGGGTLLSAVAVW